MRSLSNMAPYRA